MPPRSMLLEQMPVRRRCSDAGRRSPGAIEDEALRAGARASGFQLTAATLEGLPRSHGQTGAILGVARATHPTPSGLAVRYDHG
jgi:hypothetical protein